MGVLDRFRLDGKVAIVTGGSRGLGRVMASALAEAGASVVLTARSAESAEAAAGGIPGRSASPSTWRDRPTSRRWSREPCRPSGASTSS